MQLACSHCGGAMTVAATPAQPVVCPHCGRQVAPPSLPVAQPVATGPPMARPLGAAPPTAPPVPPAAEPPPPPSPSAAPVPPTPAPAAGDTAGTLRRARLASKRKSVQAQTLLIALAIPIIIGLAVAMIYLANR